MPKDVPVEVYLATVLGVAVLGVIGSVVAALLSGRVARKVAESTNAAHAKQVEDQLVHAREQAQADREQEHRLWVRDKRRAAYETFHRLLTELEETARASLQPDNQLILLSDPLGELATGIDAFLFWASDECAAAGQRANRALTAALLAVIEFKRGNAGLEQVMLAIDEVPLQIADVRREMQRSLGIRPWEADSGSGSEESSEVDDSGV